MGHKSKHVASVLCTRTGSFLVRGLPTGDEPDLLETKTRLQRKHRLYVSEVNRIEYATEYTQHICIPVNQVRTGYTNLPARKETP